MAKQANRYCIRKFVMAGSLKEALKLEKSAPIADAMIVEFQVQPALLTETSAIGFQINDEQNKRS